MFRFVDTSYRQLQRDVIRGNFIIGGSDSDALLSAMKKESGVPPLSLSSFSEVRAFNERTQGEDFRCYQSGAFAFFTCS